MPYPHDPPKPVPTPPRPKKPTDLSGTYAVASSPDAPQDPNAPDNPTSTYTGRPGVGLGTTGASLPPSAGFDKAFPNVQVKDLGNGTVQIDNGQIIPKAQWEAYQAKTQADYAKTQNPVGDNTVLSPASQLVAMQQKFASGGYGRGQAAKTAFADDLAKYGGYAPEDVKHLVDAADKVNKLGISPADLQTAYEHGVIKSRGEYVQKLKDLGVPDESLGIFADLADDGKENYSRTHAQDLKNDATTNANVDKLARQQAFDQSNIMTQGGGRTTEFTKTPADNLVIGGYKMGDYDRGMAKTKLMKQSGYSEQDAETLLHAADQPAPAGAPHVSAPHGAGGGGTVNAAGGTREMHPQAAKTVNDFRSNFASNIQGLGGAVTPAARAWAMNNQDLFFQPGSDSASVGAAQIQNLYEGMGAGGTRAGYSHQGGTIQARSL